MIGRYGLGGRRSRFGPGKQPNAYAANDEDDDDGNRGDDGPGVAFRL